MDALPVTKPTRHFFHFALSLTHWLPWSHCFRTPLCRIPSFLSFFWFLSWKLLTVPEDDGVQQPLTPSQAVLSAGQQAFTAAVITTSLGLATINDNWCNPASLLALQTHMSK
jgi:hypothetical protein